MYLVKTPWWLPALYPSLTWRKKTADKTVYLTFDDGPHPTATPFVLDQLKKYNAKASFFCIGKNVSANHGIYERILREEHSVGNHTQHHLNGWKVKDAAYLEDVSEAAKLIPSGLFRPPYGRIRYSQIRKLRKINPDLQIIMWDVLSGDFDTDLTGEACLAYTLYHARAGSIVVFHDSAKAWPRLEFALPKVLEALSEKGYTFARL